MAIVPCPECGNTVSSTAKQCPHCGCVFTVCPECGRTFLGKPEICADCGYKITKKDIFALAHSENLQKEQLEESISAGNLRAVWKSADGTNAMILKIIKTISFVSELLCFAVSLIAVVQFATANAIGDKLERLSELHKVVSNLSIYAIFACLFIFIAFITEDEDVLPQFACANWMKKNKINLIDKLEENIKERREIEEKYNKTDDDTAVDGINILSIAKDSVKEVGQELKLEEKWEFLIDSVYICHNRIKAAIAYGIAKIIKVILTLVASIILTNSLITNAENYYFALFWSQQFSMDWSGIIWSVIIFIAGLIISYIIKQTQQRQAEKWVKELVNSN